MSPCVNHLGKNNTRLTLKQQLMLISEDQTTDAREPENGVLTTDERLLKERACSNSLKDIVLTLIKVPIYTIIRYLLFWELYYG